MTAPKENPSNRPRGDAERLRHLEAVRAVLKERAVWPALLREERRFAEFMESCVVVLDHLERLKLEHDDLSLVHEAILEHATSIENDLERSDRNTRDEMEVARQVQRALLPEPSVTFASEFEIAIHHKQLQAVGGDYYDFFYLTDAQRGIGHHAIGVYDISGHGVSSALIMAFLKAQFAAATHNNVISPGAIVDWVNRNAYPFLRAVRRYATVNFVTFDPRKLRYVSGGGYGIVVRPGGARTFNRVSNFIGLRIKPFNEFELPFEKNDVLALYTDGMFEAQDASGEIYSVQRLNDMVVNHSHEPVQTILERCIEDYNRFRVEDADDITLIILRRCS